MKYVNYLILFTLIFVSFIFKDQITLSTNMLSLFAPKESIQRLSIATELGYTKEMLVAVKGFENSSKKTVDELSKKFKKVDGIEFVESKVEPTKEIQKYYREFYPILAEFDNTHQSTEAIKEKLQSIYDGQANSFFYTPIDKNDPLKLFSLNSTQLSNTTTKGGYLTLGDYGYFIRIKTNVSPSEMAKAKELYKSVKEITDKYENVIAFAGFFYTVENSSEIKKNVTLIVVLSTILLLLIYIVMLRDVKLLSNTFLAIFSSMLFALLLSTLVYKNFHVISMAFGMSVSAVSIDYLFHYYFHNFYTRGNIIDKNVLYGYLTTTVAFGIFCFIPIPLIAQISFFTVMALSFAYFVFTFVFPVLRLKEFEQNLKEQKSFKVVPAYVVLFTSVILLVYTLFNIKFDNNIRNLDYQNEKLKSIENIFKNSSKSKYYPVIVEAKSEDELITNLNKLRTNVRDSLSLASFVPEKNECLKKIEILQKYDFKNLNKIVNEESKKIGFKDGYFNSSYDFASHPLSCDKFDLSIFKSYNFGVLFKDNTYYTMALVSDIESASKLQFAHALDTKAMFEKVSQKMYKDISIYSLIVLFVIFSLILLSVRKKFLYAINYILFPLALVLSILVSFFEINIMHIFSLIILIAIGIDYGIYMSNTNKITNTMLAIKYSLLSTFAAFGVLIFSTITALNSIGLVISLGVGAIFILIKVMK